MYLPKHFEVSDTATVHAFMRAYPFATLVSVIDGAPFATQLPLLLDVDADGAATLLGHVAMGNKHHIVFDGAHETLAIFHGPHAYVSPSWYNESPAVPTWNYAAVHAHGRPQAVNDEAWLSAFVDRLTQHFDPAYSASADVPTEFRSRLIKGIVGFCMPVERIAAKYKLSQNRSEPDQRSVVAHLAGGGDAAGRELAELMSSRLGLETPQR